MQTLEATDRTARAVQPGPKAEAFHIPSLDGMRAVAFLIVFLSHAGLRWCLPGYVGLSVFFFLSGFLITTLLRIEYDRSGDISLKQFYLRRILRIFPPLYLVLAAACGLVLSGFVRGSVLPGTVLIQAAHLTNYYIIYNGWWTGIAPGTWVYWSLAVEEHFYLFFPIVYLAFRRYQLSPRKQALALVAMCLVVLVWRCVLIFHFHVWKERTYLATDTRVDAILIGCILAVWRNPVLDKDAFAEKTLAWIWLPLGVSMFLVSVLVRAPDFEQTLRYTLQSVGLFPIFVAAIKWHDRGVLRILNSSPMRRLGTLSYSLYLMHTVAIWVFEERTKWSSLTRGVVEFAVLLVLASLIHVLVEKPCARIRRKMSRYMDARGDADRSRPAPSVAA